MPNDSPTPCLPTLCLLAAMLLPLQASRLSAGGPDGNMIKLTLGKRTIEGAPLVWDVEAVHLLARDGCLWEFAPEEATDFQVTSAQFRPYSPSEFRSVLLRELGDGYEVSGTGHYLIAHPANQRDKWAQRFEDLYRSFVHFFSVRGMNISPPPFPLIGIVCRNQAEFARLAAADGNPSANGILGYYDIKTNRINLYDMGGRTQTDWKENAAVLIHEATHQTAFNTGVNNRYCLPPTWLVEGLATLFEAPGVYDSRNFTQRNDRVNRQYLKAFRDGVEPYHRPQLIVNIVATDDVFRLKPGAAYAEAWALTFFFIETEPGKYIEYLKRTAARPPFQEYTSEERLADFTAVFGADWDMLQAKFLRFMAGIQ